MNLPYIAYVDYGKTVDVSFKQLMANDNMFAKGVPWRLLHASFEAVICKTKTKDSFLTSFPPAFLQVALNSASSSNVESIASTRFMVTQQMPRRRKLRMRSPNLWKEDEQRDQALLSLANLSFGDGPPQTTIVVHIQAVIQLGPVSFSNPIRSIPSNYDVANVTMSSSSLSETFSHLHLDSSQEEQANELVLATTRVLTSGFRISEENAMSGLNEEINEVE